MIIIDANYILRYVLNDIESLANESKEVIENKTIFIPHEVIAEVVYVLQKIYNVPRNKISKLLVELIEFNNINLYNKPVVIKALEIFKTKKLDFVDCVLCAFNKSDGDEIKTFDKKLLKCINIKK